MLCDSQPLLMTTLSSASAWIPFLYGSMHVWLVFLHSRVTHSLVLTGLCPPGRGHTPDTGKEITLACVMRVLHTAYCTKLPTEWIQKSLFQLVLSSLSTKFPKPYWQATGPVLRGPVAETHLCTVPSFITVSSVFVPCPGMETISVLMA
eukprot:scpid98079/ scgid7794/ 